MNDNINFNNGNEFFTHRERNDGNHDLIYGQNQSQEHEHVVFDPNGNVKFLRENGQIKADDSINNQ